MSPLLKDNARSCPRCGAHGRAGADWCTLCYADLRPAPEPTPVVEPEPLVEPLPLDESALAEFAPLEGGPPSDPVPPKGKHAKRVPSGEDTRPEPIVNTDAMLAMLAAETPRHPITGIGDQLDSMSAKVVVMVGGVVLIGGLFLVFMVLAGSLL